MDNIHRYGFRWVGSLSGDSEVHPLKVPLASGVNFNINGDATNYNLYPGDPVKMLSTGYWTLAGGFENAANAADPVDGIVAHIGPFYDSSLGRMRPGTNLPSGVTYGTNFERQSFVYVIPTGGQIFEIDADATTLNTMALIIDAYNNNYDMQLAGVAANLSVNPMLHMAAGGGTATAGWRLLRLSDTVENQDITGLYVKFLVTVNEAKMPPFSAVGV